VSVVEIGRMAATSLPSGETIMLAVLLYGAVFVALLWPETPTARAITRIAVGIHDWLRRRITWSRVLLAVLVLFMLVGMVTMMGTEGLPIIGAAAPEAFAWFITFDIATYFDVLVFAWALAAALRVRSVAASAASLLRKARRVTLRTTLRMRRAARTRPTTTRRPRPPRKSNDDAHGWWLAMTSPKMAWA
jgi:hypothetical protein